jgi:hypothetical protein
MAFQDIRKSRKWLSAEEVRVLVLAAILLLVLLAVNITLARQLPGGEWFFLRWNGARAFLIEKTQPYSTEVAQRTQEIAYGRRAFSSEYGFVLNDPFFIVLLYAPLVLLQNLIANAIPSLAPLLDFASLRAVWMLLSQISLVATVILALNLSEWEPPRWLYVCLIGWGLFSYFSLNALMAGTPTIMLALLYLGILLALRSHSDELAGILLSLVAYQWEVGSLFFLFILLFAFTNGRWGVLAGLAMALFVLLVISFMVYQGWGLPYLRAVLSDWYRGMNFNLDRIASNWFPDTRFSIASTVSIVAGILLFLEWISSVHAHFRRVVWTACLSLAVTPLMGFPIFPSNHVVLILPLILILALVWERWQRRRILLTILILLLIFLVPYGFYLRAVSLYDPLVNDLISILPPIAAITGLYWMRWRVVRLPRTWFDRLGG